MKKKSYGLFGLALLLILCSTLSGAQAYFTANAWASGSKTIRLGSVNEIHEDFLAWTKHVTIQADADSEPVFVRARAYADAAVSLTISDEKNAWTDGGDGWWYHAAVLNASETSSELLIKVTGLPEGAKPGTDFNVIVVYEYTRALYRADGSAYADWTAEPKKGGAE